MREAVFSMLSSLDAIRGAAVLDLFAGSGALGIEAMSRGAARAVLVESSGQAVDAITANLAVLGDRESDVRIVRGDALAYSRTCGYFDVVFADPPYAFGGWEELGGALETRAGLLVIETTDRQPSVEEILGSLWETVKVKRYGGTVVLVVRPLAVEGPAEEGNS